MISVIIPSYNEEQMINKTSAKLKNVLNQNNIEFELWFVDDGSCDKTWEKITGLSKEDSSVHGIHFSRNFGKEAAITAGLSNCNGDCAVVIDCDLQHPPEKIIEMYRLWQQGYEVVEAVKTNRGKESVIHSLSAGTFYRLISSVTHIDMRNASDFKLIDRKAILVLVNLREKNAFFRALSSWIGFKSTQIEFEVQEREVGKSKWSTKQLIKYALTNIISFSTFPMQIVTWFGFVAVLTSIVLTVLSLIRDAGMGRLLNAVLLLGTSGIIMMALGMIGCYIGKIYEELKDRPRYIISAII